MSEFSQEVMRVALPVRMKVLRTRVLHGHTWTPEEQREVWQLLTGEVVEPGKRCEACGGEGDFGRLSGSWLMGAMEFDGTYSLLAKDGGFIRQCNACKDHPGFERLPTWMEGGR